MSARRHENDTTVRGRWKRLAATCLIAAGVTYIIDLAFDTNLLGVLWQAVLVAFACALMVAVWKVTSDNAPRRDQVANRVKHHWMRLVSAHPARG